MSSSESVSSGSSSDDDDGVKRPNKKLKETKKSDAATNESRILMKPLDAAQQLELSSTSSKIGKNQPIIILLDQATLETVKNRRGVFELLNCDDHRDLCKKKLRKDPNAFRPDILHQELLALLDSPLNKAGMLKLYIQTNKNVLIDIHPSVRIPRTYKRFAGLMVQLLHKMKIKAGSESTVLLKVIKNPFSQYLPPGTRCYGMSCQGTLYSPNALAKTKLPTIPPSASSTAPPTCFVVGAMATGHITLEDHPYIEEMISVSEYPLSGAAALSRIAGGIEQHWGIV